jgi:hypothetical protein
MHLDLANLTHVNDFLRMLPQHFPHELMASGNFNQDILGEMQKAWANFIKTGQVWAMVIGFFIGYLLRSFTSY